MGSENWELYPMALPEKTPLCGKYIIKDVLGLGGFGITYIAEEHKTGELFAIKEYMPGSLSVRRGHHSIQPQSPGKREYFEKGKKGFKNEAEMLSSFIGHPGIVHVFSYFEEYGNAYYVMEYVQGQNLEAYLLARSQKVEWKAAWELLRPIIDALDAVHKYGIVHRDVKPENILIRPVDEVKLIDFGAARYSLGKRTQNLTSILTPGYAPVEQYRQQSKQGPFTDLYAFAATYYHVITGADLPDALDREYDLKKGLDRLLPPSKLGVPITKKAEAVLLKALSVDPDVRYQTMEEFRLEMDGVFLSNPIKVDTPIAGKTEDSKQHPGEKTPMAGMGRDEPPIKIETPVTKKTDEDKQKISKEKWNLSTKIWFAFYIVMQWVEFIVAITGVSSNQERLYYGMSGLVGTALILWLAISHKKTALVTMMVIAVVSALFNLVLSGPSIAVAGLALPLLNWAVTHRDVQ